MFGPPHRWLPHPRYSNLHSNTQELRAPGGRPNTRNMRHPPQRKPAYLMCGSQHLAQVAAGPAGPLDFFSGHAGWLQWGASSLLDRKPGKQAGARAKALPRGGQKESRGLSSSFALWSLTGCVRLGESPNLSGFGFSGCITRR